MVHAVHFNILKTPAFSRAGHVFAQFLLNKFFLVRFKIAISIVFIVI